MQIISEIEAGKTKSDVSRALGLASSTVATIWKNRDNILTAYGCNEQSSHSQSSSDHLPHWGSDTLTDKTTATASTTCTSSTTNATTLDISKQKNNNSTLAESSLICSDSVMVCL